MPLIRSNPWEEASGSGQIGNSIAQMAIQLPEMRMRMQQQGLQNQLLQGQIGQIPLHNQMLQSQVGMLNARNNMYKQHGNFYGAKAQSQSDDDAAMGTMGQGLGTMWQKMQSGQQPDIAEIQQVSQGLTHMARTNPAKMSDFLTRMIALSSSGMATNPNAALGVIQPKLVSQVVPNGGTLMNPSSGQVIGTGAMNLAPGHGMVPPESGATPVTASLGTMNPTPQREGNFGAAASQLLGPLSPLSEQEKAALGHTLYNKITQQNSGQPAAIPAGRVTVKSPTGQIGHIPSAQLSEALKNGYSQVQ